MEGAKVYVQSDADSWRKATVVAALGSGSYRVELEPWEDEETLACRAGVAVSREVTQVDASKMEGGALPFQNANMPENGFPDMTTLDHLHEAALLHNLRVRFFAGACPYTYTADIIIAVNPYRWYPMLYTEEMRKEYLVFDRAKLPPHVYATSSVAYSGMQETRLDQSILVSGESGAGKTETVKILLGHFAFIASSEDTSHIKRIVESNPLLESFGNAQTVRNDNSSRFGKFIELELNGACRLSGSKCRTYLLEKSRVVGQGPGERNYHIFYQMLAVDAQTRAPFGLGDAAFTRDSMRYTSMGHSKTDTIEKKSDAEMFHNTIAALALVGVEGVVLTQLLRSLASVLLLGQVEFDDPKQDDTSAVSRSTVADAERAASALEVDVAKLEQALTHRTIKAGSETVVKPLSKSAAAMTRDAVAKELYARVFDWLVGRICAATRASSSEAKHICGLLDIFGFEDFAVNRFEQLCINFANEKLQQKFTCDVFKTVQQEYSREGIPWDRIEFKDNAPVLSLIEAKLGVIAMLNEECVRPKGSDTNFVSKLSTVHKADPAFSTPKLGSRKEMQFCIRHYAGSITYTVEGWLDRNRDTVSDDVLGLLRSSANALVGGVFAEPVKPAGSDTKSKGGADTVATKFRTSLVQLMETIERTTTQYVRCVKPNKSKSPAEVDNTMVIEQLRCAGVIEAIRISRAGFPARMPLAEFALRFRLLALAAAGMGFSRGVRVVQGGDMASVSRAKAAVATIQGGTDVTEACRSLLLVLAPEDRTRYEIGRTRVYFKAGVLEAFEERRALLSQAAATEITARVRGFLLRRRFKRKRYAALLMQRLTRMHACRLAYKTTRVAAIRCQAAWRATLARRRVVQLRRVRCATRLQASQRRRVAMREFFLARAAIVRLQSKFRTRYCRKRYLIDLAEHKEQAKLENQVKALQARLAAQENMTKSTTVTSAEAPAEILEALEALAKENAKLRVQLERARSENSALRKDNRELRAGQSTKSDWLSFITRSKEQSSSKERNRVHEASMDSVCTESDFSVSDLVDMVADDPPATASESAGCSGDLDKIDDSVDSVSEVVLSCQLCPSLSNFWEDVPSAGLPMLQDGSEVHIKIGPDIIMVESDGSGRNLVWQRWMTEGQGYYRSMAFSIERRAAQRTLSQRGSVVGDGLQEESSPHDDGTVGLTFALRSVLTGKFVVEGGLLSGYCLQVTGERPEDATVFTCVPIFDGAFSFTIRKLGDNKVVCLRPDSYVMMKAVSDTHPDSDIMPDTMMASIECLLPCTSYEITVEEKQIGLTVGKDLPLRVVGFKYVVQPDGTSKPGPAESTGRIHIGDYIISVNGEEIEGLARKDALDMIAAGRPVTLGFAVAEASP